MNLSSGFQKLNLVYVEDVAAAFVKAMEDGVRYDSFGFEWKCNDPILSSRDLNFRPMNSFQSPFKYGDDSN